MSLSLGPINEIMEHYYVEAIIERGEQQLEPLWGADPLFRDAVKAKGATMSRKDYAMLLLDIFAPIEDEE